ncbi:MAG TPA: DUF998 domain-containing protein [Candidatus Saccharimonadales bacterium]|nr:DUF998 domain-containing protein [Candidatus Saccharimonadales bacterium]
MKPSALINTFTDRYPLIGPMVWAISIQYYIVQVIVARAWQMVYSLSQNTISDLGNTVCGPYANRFVCSPQHNLMNASFITLGITMAAGATLIYQEFKTSRASLVGFSFMAIAGFGTSLVGLFPENTVTGLHVLGAALPFFIGNLGMVILGVVLDVPKSLRYYTIASGAISLLALGFFVTHNYLGLGQGGLERVVAYPQTMWLIVFGVYISSNHLRKNR